jgi:hypothetical protein
MMNVSYEPGTNGKTLSFPHKVFNLARKDRYVRSQWLTPVILATQEAEIRRNVVRSQPGKVVHKTLSQKNPSQKRAGGVAQGVDPEFKTQYRQKKKKN